MDNKAKRGLSLRYKLLFLLITLPLVSMSIYSVVAIDLFRSDKLAYVFEASASVSSSLSRQVESDIKNKLFKIELILKGYDSKNKKFSEIAQALFEDSKDILRIKVYEQYEGAWTVQAELETLDKKNTDRISIETIAHKMASSIHISTASIGKIHVFLKNGNQLLACLVDAQDLFSSFSTSGNYLNFLVGPGGNSLMGPNNIKTSFSNWDFFSKLKDLPQQTFSGTSPAGDELVIAISTTAINDIKVITLIEKEKALAAVKQLMSKSLLFFIIMIALALIVSLLASRKLTQTLQNLLFATRKIAKGDYDIQVDVKTQDEVGRLAESFNMMSGKISHLIAENMEKARMETELKTARAVQETLFPQSKAHFKNMKLSGYYESASECGGDWWHYSEVEDRVFLWIGDATGHGAPAALITAAAKTVSTISTQFADITPAQIMAMLNDAIFEACRGKMCMTFFIGAINKITGEITCCNASHEPPVIFPLKEDVKRRDLRFLNTLNNPRLGESGNIPFKEFQDKINFGERILFYTDGVNELKDSGGKLFGERRLIRNMAQSINEKKNVDDSVEFLKNDLKDFQGQAHLEDDVTFFMLDYARPES